MAEAGGTYLPPVIASLVGEVGDLAKTLVEGKAMLDEFSKTPATVNIKAELTSLAILQADLFKDIGGVQALAESHPIDIPMQLDMFTLLSDMSAFRLFADQPIKVPIVPDVDMAALATDRAVIGTAIGSAIAPSIWKSILAGLAASAAAGGGGGLANALGFGTAGFGAGAFGLAGFGTIASLAGFGLERVLTLAIGLIGSLAQAFMGLGVIAAGTFATMAVGMGSDMLVMSSTIADTRTLSGLWTTLQNDVLLYGANSTQAQSATAALNNELLILGNTAGVKAELGLAKLAYTINQQWDKATSNARVQAVGLLTSILLLGEKYIPLVAAAAERNLSIINKGLVPLFQWLGGPQGIGIFKDLENKFARDLPTAVHAFVGAIEFLLRFLDLASNYTGGLVRWLDKLFIYLNSPSGWARVASDVGKVVAVFQVWKDFIIILLKDIALIFGQAVGVGTTMISMLTGILNRLHTYLSSTSGKNALNNLFTVHKNEIIALLNLLPQLAPAFSVYLALAVPLTTIATDVIKLLNFMLSIPVVGPAIAWGLALIIIVNQMRLMAIYGALAGMIRAIGGAIAFAGAAAETYAVAGFGALAKSMFGVDAAMLAGMLPFLAIGALIIATGILIYLLISHWKQLSSTVGGIFSLLGTMFHNAVGQWGGAFSELGMVVQAIGHKFTTAFTTWGQVFSLLGTTIRLILGKISSDFTTAFKQWGAAFNMIGTAVHLLGVKVSTELSTMLTSAKTTLGQWYSIGSSIVTGIINGFVSKEQWAINAITNFFAGLLAAAEKALHASKSSRVYSELAASIPQGVADGITKNTATTLMALSSMFNQMQNHSRMLAGGAYGSSSLAFAGAGGGRGPLSINMPITVQVSGTSAATAQGIGNAVQQGVRKELDVLVQALQGGIYSNPGS